MQVMIKTALVVGVVSGAICGCKPSAAPVAPGTVRQKMQNEKASPKTSSPIQIAAAKKPENAPPVPLAPPPEPRWAGPEKADGSAPAEPPQTARQQDGPDRHTWKEVETLLAELREKRDTDKLSRELLNRWYERLKSPKFTESRDYEEHLEKLSLWPKEVPDSVTALVVTADAHIQYAWEARGIGLAHEVTEEGWLRFKERIAKAHELLDEAIIRGAKDGRAFASRILVAKAEGLPIEDTRRFLEAGHQLDPTYFAMYEHMSDYLLPKWHGEPGAVAPFAREVLAMLPGDDGLEALARIIKNCHCSDRTILYWGGIEPKILNDAAKVFFDRYPQSYAAANYAGLMAMAGGDQQLGQRVLAAMEKNNLAPDERAWGPEGFKHFEKWCRASSNPTSEKYRLRGSLTQVRNVAFSEDTRFIWIATHDGVTPLLLVDTHTGAEKLAVRVPGIGIAKLVIEPTQGLLVAAAVQGFNGAIVWRTSDPSRPMPIPLPGQCHYVAVSPVSPVVAAQDGSRIHLLNIEKQRLAHTLELPDALVNGLVFSPDGMLLATYARAEVSVWEVDTGKKRYSIQTPDNDPRPAIAINKPFLFDRENRLVAEYWTNKSTGGLGRFTEGKAEPEVLVPDANGGFAALSPDGRLYAVDIRDPDGQRRVNVWDVKSKTVVQVIDGHADSLSLIRFSHDSKLLATGSKGGELKIWTLPSADEEK